MANKHRQTTLSSLNGRFNILAAYVLRRTTALHYILSQSEAGAVCLKGGILPGVVGTAVRLSTGAVLATTAAETAHAAGERAAGFAFFVAVIASSFTTRRHRVPRHRQSKCGPELRRQCRSRRRFQRSFRRRHVRRSQSRRRTRRWSGSRCPLQEFPRHRRCTLGL